MAHGFQTDQEESWAGESGDKYVERNDSVDTVHRASNRHILIAEYYNSTPVEVEFGSHTESCFGQG